MCHFSGCRQGPRFLSASGRQSLTGSWRRNTNCGSLWTGNTTPDWSILRIILSSDWLAASSWTRITTPGARTRRGYSTRKQRGSGSMPAPERLSSVSLKTLKLFYNLQAYGYFMFSCEGVSLEVLMYVCLSVCLQVEISALLSLLKVPKVQGMSMEG